MPDTSISRWTTRRRLLACCLLSMIASGCIKFARPFATSSESTFARGGESTLATIPTDAATLAMEPIAIGSYVQVVVDSICYGEMPSRVASSGGNDYFVGSMLTTAASDSDDPDALQRATERTFAQGILAASDRSADMPATLIRLAVGSHRCVAQDGFRSVPVALEGSRTRHRPRATFAATYLRALRIHDIDARVHWAIALGQRLLGLVGVDTSRLTDRLRDQQQWIELVRDIGNLQRAAEVVMLGRFEVPIAPSASEGEASARIPASAQKFVLLLSPDARAREMEALVASGQLRFSAPGVASVDPALGCDTGEPTCPFTNYVVWHVEHAADRSSLEEAAYHDLSAAAAAIGGGRFGAALSTLAAFTDLAGSGVLRGHFSSDDRRMLTQVGQHLADAAHALSPEAGQASRDACEVLQRMTQAGLLASATADAMNAEVNSDLRAGLESVGNRLRSACVSPSTPCDPMRSVFSTDLGQCVPRQGCPTGSVRSGDACACPNGSAWNATAERCDAPNDCVAGYSRSANGSCVASNDASRHALPTDAPAAAQAAPVFGAPAANNAAPAATPATATTPASTMSEDSSALAAACDGHDPIACNRLGRWYSVGWAGLARDDAQAYQLFDRACDMGSLAACNNFAFMTCAGRGTSTDMASCLQIYRLDCQIGDGEACSNYATRVLASNPSEAFEYYQKACDVGVTDGCRGMATMWYVGCATGGTNASLSMCTSVSEAERIDIALSLELDACDSGDGTACREAAAILHDHPELAGDPAAARRRVVGLLYDGCALESPQSCMDYAQIVRSRDAELADRLKAFACAQEQRPLHGCP